MDIKYWIRELIIINGLIVVYFWFLFYNFVWVFLDKILDFLGLGIYVFLVKEKWKFFLLDF